MLDAASGTILATITVLPHPSALAVATTAGRVFVVSDDVTADDAGRVSVLDARSGRLLRTVAVGRGTGGHQPCPTVVSLLDARSGRVLHMQPRELPATAIAVDEHTGQAVVANSHDGTVLVLDGRAASVVRTVAVPWAPGALGVDERAGTVVVANAYYNSVSLIDAASGRVVRTVPLALPPRAIAVDQRTDRVVVLTSEEFVPSAPLARCRCWRGGRGGSCTPWPSARMPVRWRWMSAPGRSLPRP